jgi:hypothetical protein
MEKRYSILRKFGKGIVDGDGKQVAWIDDYSMAKDVCMFLNSDARLGLYPEYVMIGVDCYQMKGGVYYSDRLGISLDFTVRGEKMFSISGMGVYDGLLVEECSERKWLKDNELFI